MYCKVKKNAENTKGNWDYCYGNFYEDHQWLEDVISNRRHYKWEVFSILRKIKNVDDRIEELFELRIGFDGETVDNIPYKCIGVLRSYISCNLDSFIIGNRRSGVHLLDRHDCERCYYAPEMDFQGIKEWDSYYSNSVRKYQTHEAMVCGVVIENEPPQYSLSAAGVNQLQTYPARTLLFLITTSKEFFEVTPSQLRCLALNNMVGGVCICEGLVCLTEEMIRLCHCEGKGIGRFFRKKRELYLFIPRYVKDSKGWYIENRIICNSSTIALELLDAGFRLEDDKGNKLTRATVALATLIME